MADHLDFIAIRGLQSAATEVFQGIGGGLSFAGSSGGGGSGDLASLTAGLNLSEFFDQFADSFYNLWDFLDSESAENTASRGLGRSRSLPAIIPIAGKFAGLFGGLQKALGPSALALFVQIVNKIGTVIVEEIDPGSPRNQVQAINQCLEDIRDILKTGLIYEEGLLGTDKSILGAGLLKEVDGAMISRLEDLSVDLEALQYNDEEIDFGPFRVKLRSKVLDYN